MEIKEIKAGELDPKKFVKEKVEEIRKIVGDGKAIVALSGGVDSSTTTLLGHKALGDRLKVYFIDDGLMREGEAKQVASTFKKLGIKVRIISAQREFFEALKGKIDPEEKREAITQTFYRVIFARLIRAIGAKFLFHGTILTDIEETIAGIKRQHNILEQLGIDTEKEFGYKLVEPLKQIRKDGVRKVAKALGLPESIYNRMPFCGPGLSARVIGEVTPEKIAIVRKATTIIEEELRNTKAFQYLAILHEDKVTGNSVIKITSKLDSGPIFKQSKIEISSDDNYTTLSHKLAVDGGKLLKEVMQDFEKLKPLLQNEKMASRTSIISKNDGLINWNEKAHLINAKIKAFANWPTCFTNMDNLKLIIKKAEMSNIPSNKPGQITIKCNEIFVSASDYYLRILLIQPSGRKEMDHAAFANGYKRLDGKILNV